MSFEEKDKNSEVDLNLKMRRKYSEVKIVVKYFKYLKISDLRPPDKSGREEYFKKKIYKQLKLAAFRGGEFLILEGSRSLAIIDRSGINEIH